MPSVLLKSFEETNDLSADGYDEGCRGLVEQDDPGIYCHGAGAPEALALAAAEPDGAAGRSDGVR
jgi:hypothetical protein